MSSFWSEIWEEHIRGKESPALFLRVVLERIDREASDPQHLRIRADGRFFFAHASLFKETPDFSSMKPGEELFVGAHRLGDGCFWLHWLRTRSGVEFVPRDDGALAARKREIAGTGKLLANTGFAILCILILLSFFSRQPAEILAFLMGIIGIALIGYGTYLIQHGAAFVRAVGGHKWQKLQNGLERIRHGDDSGFAALPPKTVASDNPYPAHGLPGALRRGVNLACGPIAAIQLTSREGQGVSINDVHHDGPVFKVYTISCGGRAIEFPGQPITEKTFTNLHASTLNKRFLFLAEGDRITAFMNAHEGLLRKLTRILPAPFEEEAVALINHEDGHVATSMAVQLVDPRRVWLVLGVVCGLTLALLLAMYILMALSADASGNRTFPVFGFFGLIAIWAALCLLWELGKNGVLLLTGTPSERRLWEERILAIIQHLAPGGLKTPPRGSWTGAAGRAALLAAIGIAAITLIHLCI